MFFYLSNVVKGPFFHPKPPLKVFFLHLRLINKF